VDGKPLNDLQETIPVLGKTTIAIEAIGTIVVEPQIKNRAVLLKRQQSAADEWSASLEAAAVPDLTAARLASARRKEYERSVTAVRKELANLAPGNRQKKIAAGLEALKSHVGELRGRLKSEMEKLKLTVLLEGDGLDAEVAKNHEDGTRLTSEVALAEVGLRHSSLESALVSRARGGSEYGVRCCVNGRLKFLKPTPCPDSDQTPRRAKCRDGPFSAVPRCSISPQFARSTGRSPARNFKRRIENISMIFKLLYNFALS
jgi:hypothetical protein